MLQKTLLLALLTELLLSGPPAARADFFIHNWSNHHEKASTWNLGLSSLYYTTTSNYDSSGSAVSIASLSRYTRIQTDFNMIYGISDHFSIYGRLAGASISQSGNFSSSAYGLTDQTVGVNFRIYDGKLLSLDLQVQTDFPVYSNSTSASNRLPYLGDGSVDISSGFFGTLLIYHGPTNSIFLTGGAGYTYRTAGYSSAVPFSLFTRYQPSKSGLFAQLGVAGVFSLSTDQYTNVLPQIIPGSNGSYITGAVNPSLIQVQAQGGYLFNPQTEFSVFGNQTIWGQSTAQSFNVGLTLQVRLEGHNRKNDPLTQSPWDYSHANSGFLNYSLDAKVTQTNDRLNLVKIDKGSQDGIEVGQIFDLFNKKQDGLPEGAVARSRVMSVKTTESVNEITEYYKDSWIEEGFIAKRLIPQN